MASLIIRQLDPQTKAKLRVRAAKHHRSMEAEAREILRDAVSTEDSSSGQLFTRLRQIANEVGGVELELPTREPMREPMQFE